MPELERDPRLTEPDSGNDNVYSAMSLMEYFDRFVIDPPTADECLRGVPTVGWDFLEISRMLSRLSAGDSLSIQNSVPEKLYRHIDQKLVTSRPRLAVDADLNKHPGLIRRVRCFVKGMQPPCDKRKRHDEAPAKQNLPCRLSLRRICSVGGSWISAGRSSFKRSV